MKNMPSIETRKEMFKFFMRTSAPRLVQKMKLEEDALKAQQTLECSTNKLNNK